MSSLARGTSRRSRSRFADDPEHSAERAAGWSSCGVSVRFNHRETPCPPHATSVSPPQSRALCWRRQPHKQPRTSLEARRQDHPRVRRRRRVGKRPRSNVGENAAHRPAPSASCQRGAFVERVERRRSPALPGGEPTVSASTSRRSTPPRTVFRSSTHGRLRVTASSRRSCRRPRVRRGGTYPRRRSCCSCR